MQAEILSFGGYVGRKFERRKHVHVIEDTANKVSVLVRIATRDPKTQRVKYELFDSFDVGGAKPEEVYAAAKEGVLRAGTAQKK